MRSLVVAGCIGLAGIVAPASSLAGTDPMTGTDAVVTNTDGDNVRIRSEASLGAAPVTKVPEGTELTIIEGPVAASDGTTWFRVDVAGVTGFISADFVSVDDPAGVPEDVPGIPAGTPGAGIANDTVHLRSGPSLAYASIGTVTAGDALTLSGDAIDGWLRVTWNGKQGWIDSAFVDASDATPPAVTPAPQPPVTETPAPETPQPGATGTRYALEDVNLRTEPAFDSTIARVIPKGTAIALTGETQNGFVKGTVDGDTGWFAPEFLGETPGTPPATETPETPAPQPTETPAPTQTPTQAPTPTPTQTPPPAPSGSTIVWPMKDGEWRVLQGYNGSSHQDRGSLWQYEDSFDLVRSDGSTAGQATYSPVTGVVRWLDPSTGGISIDVGDGLAVALFHIDVDASITAGDQITQGQYIGTVSGPGGGGNGGTPHIHLTAWATDDGGNWSRESIPFEGVAAIAGQEFPNDGSSLQWTGTVIRP